MMDQNTKAFLDTIAFSELGRLVGLSDDGYNVIVGSTPSRPILFDSYEDHPRRPMQMLIGGKFVTSTAAGRYQVLERYFDHYKQQLGLPDFGKDSQDRIALQLVRECGALDDISAGRISDALRKCRSRWASFPGAGYEQNEHSADTLLTAFKSAGGVLA